MDIQQPDLRQSLISGMIVMWKIVIPALVICSLILTGCTAVQVQIQITEQAPLTTPVPDKAQIQFLEFYSPF